MEKYKEKRRTRIVQDKIQKALDLICILYKDDIIVHAYIIGSVARGNARPDSDIDILLINPSFLDRSELEPISEQFIVRSSISDDDKKELLKELTDQNRLVNKLKDIGAEFKRLELADIRTDYKLPFWYQQLNGELFHIMTWSNVDIVKDEPYTLEISKGLCDSQR